MAENKNHMTVSRAVAVAAYKAASALFFLGAEGGTYSADPAVDREVKRVLEFWAQGLAERATRYQVVGQVNNLLNDLDF